MGYGLMINIIFEDNHLLVVEKPINVPVCLDNSGDNDLQSQLKEYLKQKYQKPGNVFLAMVHRLDRPVSGVMVFAKTSKAASRLSEQIRTNKFNKQYLTVVQGKPKKSDTLKDYLLKDKKTNTVRIDENGKYAELSYQLIDTKNELSLLLIKLKTGRSHQIRVQLSNQSLPIFGDQRYNKAATLGKQIALHSYHLSFIHPITKERLHFTCNPSRHPFSLYSNSFPIIS